MNALPPIPTPAARRWREFRIRLLPGVVFLAAAAAAIVIWRTSLAGPTLVGQVEPVQATVSSYKPGLLAHLNVTRFQQVKKDDPVGQVLITDPRILASTLAGIQADLELLRVNMLPIMDQQRVAISFDQLRLDWMRHKAQLAAAKVNLQLAESEFQRTSQLFKEQIVAARVLEQAQANKERFRTEVDELMRLVNAQEARFAAMTPSEAAAPSRVSTDPLRAAMAVQEARLRQVEAELSPITLLVPMDGMVSMICRRSGEAVTAGEPIIVISALHSESVVGYLRQPFPVEPRVGMSVEVRTRGLRRAMSPGKILAVGTQLEPIAPALVSPLRTANIELGLPILVSLPPGLKTRPGEIVDLRIDPRPK